MCWDSGARSLFFLLLLALSPFPLALVPARQTCHSCPDIFAASPPTALSARNSLDNFFQSIPHYPLTWGRFSNAAAHPHNAASSTKPAPSSSPSPESVVSLQRTALALQLTCPRLFSSRRRRAPSCIDRRGSREIKLTPLTCPPSAMSGHDLHTRFRIGAEEREEGRRERQKKTWRGESERGEEEPREERDERNEREEREEREARRAREENRERERERRAGETSER
eukprot:3385183-Rhodomonas_salina.4